MSSKFQHRHYEEMAALVRRHYNGAAECKVAVALMADDMEDTFAADNPKFDRLRWRKAAFGNDRRGAGQEPVRPWPQSVLKKL